MRVLLYTGASLRHFALAALLRSHFDTIVVSEASRPATVAGPAMKECARRMIEAETAVFGRSPLAISGLDNGRVYVVPFGQPFLPPESFDRVVVFGASWIRGALLDSLVAREAINLHMGLAPEYRGTACNFWAEYDERPELVGATLHRLTATIDGGPILATVTVSRAPGVDPWRHGMFSVQAGHNALVDLLHRETVTPTPQDRSRTLRYSRGRDYTEAVCASYLTRLGIAFA